MALYLLKILEMTPFFYNGGSDPRNVSLQDKVSIGAVILRHLQNLPCNAHEISEMELFTPSANTPAASTNGNAKDSTVHEIGAGVFALLSLLNHSCDPNVVRHYYSSGAVVRAIRYFCDKIQPLCHEITISITYLGQFGKGKSF